MRMQKTTIPNAKRMRLDEVMVAVVVMINRQPIRDFEVVRCGDRVRRAR